MLRIFTPVKIQRLRPGLNPVLQARYQGNKLSYFTILVLPDDWLMKPEKHVYVRVRGHCISIITLIQFCAFIGLNRNSGIVINGTENVKHFVFCVKVRAV